MPGGRLYIVATPIGNLEDITYRAVRILKAVDAIAAEDTRHSLKLLSALGIQKPLISYWSENEKARSEEVLSSLRAGFSVALISDAGTPGISDPGSVLIKKAIEGGIEVIPVPGPSAAIAALSVSGLPTEEFTFIGFLPPKSGQRRKRMEQLALEERTIVFYEAPHRIVEMVEDLLAVFGDRQALVMREISKLHEQTFRGSLSQIFERLATSTIAGEYVVAVAGMMKESVSIDVALQEIRALMKKGFGRKDAVKRVAESYGLSKKELYDKSLE
ncbi:MAG TPA: 16S rRNA (cytidine(1402)-2'-O)-methyltransferase [Dissulfurispiraceae bacterium]|nr:16S rRNA (cytidine(1402)-2'-O)-methyltransferase [Dissulfurispiraceae bacterium]